MITEAAVLNVVGKCGTLDEAMLVLHVVKVLQGLELLLGVLQHFRVVFLKCIVGNSGSDKVSIVPPGVGSIREHCCSKNK